jgi:hypothetical protein
MRSYRNELAATTAVDDRRWAGSPPCRSKRPSRYLPKGSKMSYATPNVSPTFTPPIKSRANVLGVGVHAIDLPSGASIVENAVREGMKGYVCVTE